MKTKPLRAFGLVSRSGGKSLLPRKKSTPTRTATPARSRPRPINQKPILPSKSGTPRKARGKTACPTIRTIDPNSTRAWAVPETGRLKSRDASTPLWRKADPLIGPSEFGRSRGSPGSTGRPALMRRQIR
jgi:hypothetical protein